MGWIIPPRQGRKNREAFASSAGVAFCSIPFCRVQKPARWRPCRPAPIHRRQSTSDWHPLGRGL